MAAKGNRAKSLEKRECVQGVGDVTRLTNLVALLLVKGESQSEKIRTLNAAGYSPTEIASLLGTTANTVNVTLHKIRKRRG